MSAAEYEPVDFAALAELGEAFTALVEALRAGGDLTAITPARIVELAATCMPSSRGVALSVADHATTRSAAAVGTAPQEVDRIRTETGQGPVLDVLETNDLIVSNDVNDDPRWPLFGARVSRELGVHSIVSYRLYLNSRLRAALTFYSDWPHAFDELAIATGSIFAAYCSLSVLTTTLLQEQITARRAVEVQREIGVAAGILMATEGVSLESAYQLLHRAGRRLQRTLPDLAHDVIGQHRLPDQ